MIQKFKDWWKRNCEPRFKEGDYAKIKETGEIVKLLSYRHLFKGIYIGTIILPSGKKTLIEGPDLEQIPEEQQKLLKL